MILDTALHDVEHCRNTHPHRRRLQRESHDPAEIDSDRPDLVAAVVEDVPGRELRSLADDLKRRIGSGVVAVIARDDGKAAIVVGVTDDLTPRLDAVRLVRAGKWPVTVVP